MDDILEYNPETGDLKWKERPRSYFNTLHAQRVWNSQNSGKSIRKPDIGINGKKYRTARVIWFLAYGYYPEGQVEFINKDDTDFRLCNLTVRSPRESGIHRSTGSLNTSGHKGIYYCNDRGAWRVHIKSNGRKISVGQFQDIGDAIAARRRAEDKYFGTGGGNRTHNSFRKPDFESGASTNSATPAENRK